MMRARQCTLRRAIATQGVGLHTGVSVNLRFCPAPPYAGIVFHRVDLEDFEIPASPQFVTHVSYQTALVRKGVLVATVEHVIAALVGTGIDNVIVEVDGFEMPIMDGSAAPFVKLIQEAGLLEQDAPRQHIRIRQPVKIVDGPKSLVASPSDRFSIHYTIEFDHPLIGRQGKHIALSEKTFVEDVAPARTFTFLSEIEALRKMGLIRGGSLENAVVLDDTGILNEDALRFNDEFVRHKILDLIGDLGLLGRPILGHIQAERAGHAMHNALVTRLIQEPHTWEIVETGRSNSATSL
jgi:UDP-3-O-[3-hydroxymyristoyl] N-acetylglucosamine deacetylase